MKKIFTLFVSAMAVCSLMAHNTYKKVTVAPEDWSGTYLIVCEDQGVVFNGAADEENIDAKGGPAILQNITFNEEGTLTGSEALDAAVFTIAETENDDWPWSIQSASGLYIGHKDTIDNGLSAETELKKKCMHTLSLDDNANLIATPQYELGGEYNLQYNKKSDQLRFRYFVPNDKKAVQLYKLETATAVENTARNTRSTKRMVNGQVVIVRDGKMYNLLGAEL